MDISDIGEAGLIKKINQLFSAELPDHLVGIGDDCAVIPKNEQASILVSTDLLVENVHFLRADISPELLGYKSIAVNLSDIAAMGGTPQYLFLSLALPSNISEKWLDEYFLGIKKIADQYHVLLLGGDTTHAEKDIVINVAIMGEAPSNNIKYRSTAQLGDIVCVTDYVGDSAGGLYCILHQDKQNSAADYLIQQHYRPTPQIQEGLFLAHELGVHAMMDLSDGVNLDVTRLMAQSHCGIDIDIEALPISMALHELSQLRHFNAVEMAAIGGEDYCLLVTIDQNSFVDIAKQFEKKFNKPLKAIGRITNTVNQLNYFLNNNPYQLEMKSFSHF